MKCCKCGNDLPPDSRFCQYCGSDLSEQKCCPFCGTPLQDGMNFCPECGKSVCDPAAAQSAAPNIPAPPPEETAIPAGEDPAATGSADAAPTGPLENQALPAASREDLFDCSLHTQRSIPEEEIHAPEESVFKSGEEPLIGETSPGKFPLPPPESQIKEAAAADSAPVKAGKDKRLWIALLCAAIAAAAGIFLWLGYDRASGRSDAPVDISEIARSVLYLEVFDENDELISSASGFLVNNQTTLVTNYHVVQDAFHIVAVTADGTQSTDVSCILAYDEIADLAVLKCDAKAKAEPLTICDSETVRQSDAVYAIGYPLGLANTLSDGIVSSRYIDEYKNDIIQVTAAISSGSSGGPLLNADGQVIGVICAYYIYGQNLNIAIASNALEALLDSKCEKTELKSWSDRPAMPDAEAEIEEFRDPGPQEGEDPAGNTGSETEAGTEPEAPASAGGLPQMGGSNHGAPDEGSPDRPEPPAAKKPEEILQGAWIRESTDPASNNQYDYFEFAGNHVYSESYYCSSDAEFVLVYTGTFTVDENRALCLHMTHEEVYFADGQKEVDDALDTHWTPRQITALSEDSFTTAGFPSYHRASERPGKLSEWEANRQSEKTSAFSFLAEWITNNGNSTMGTDKSYQETLTDENIMRTCRIIYNANINQICLMNSNNYSDGVGFTTFLWLTPTGNTFNSTFTQYDTVNSVTIFEGSKAIQASSFNADSTFVFDSCKGDSNMLDTRQSVAAYMVLDSLRFLDHVFNTYAAPSGYRFSTSDFGFHI